MILTAALLAGAAKAAPPAVATSSDRECRKAFLSYMNAKARDLGMAGTHYESPSGLTQASYSTPQDGLKLGLATTAYPEALEIWNTPSRDFPVTGPHSRTLSVKNNVIPAVKDVLAPPYSFFGGKGGSLTYADSHRAQILLVEIKGRRVVLSLMALGKANFKNIFKSAKELCDMMADHLDGKTPVEGTNLVALVGGAGGYAACVVPDDPALKTNSCASAELLKRPDALSRAPEVSRFPASTSKVMTMLCALDFIRDARAETVTVKKGDISDGSGSKFFEGDTLTMHDALRIMMMESSNTLANTIGRTIGERILAAHSLSVSAVADEKPAAILVDGDIPAGNIVVEGVAGDTIRLRQDLRDSPDWFYWAFRVRGAAGRTLNFKFTGRPAPVSARGPAVTKDGGRTWAFAARSSSPDGFTYAFGPDEREVWFYQTFQYLPPDWDAFLKRHAADRGRLFETGELCKSRKGRSVPKAVFGRIDGKARYRVFLSSRHHCGEATGTFVLEGFVGQVFAEGALGEWLRENVEILAVPFVDYDGVVDGDQGKNRRPHDHNRDYSAFLHPETKAIAEWIASRADNDIDVFLDLHSPWVRGGENEMVFLTYGSNEQGNAAKRRWGELLEKAQTGSLAYRASDNFPWNFKWNKSSNVATGLKSSTGWAFDALRGPRMVATYEIPFAKANGKTVTPQACRELGAASAQTLRDFLAEDPPRIKRTK